MSNLVKFDFPANIVALIRINGVICNFVDLANKMSKKRVQMLQILSALCNVLAKG
jgi:hypothetical protein